MEKVSIELNDSARNSVGTPTGFLENLAFILLLPLPFLLPLFFIPSTFFPFQFSKMILLSILVLVAFGLWIIARLKDGKFVLPRTSLTFAALAILLVTLVSAAASGAFKTSLVGQVLEIGTVGSSLILFLLMFLVPIVFQSKDRIFYAYLVFFAAFFVIALFHLLRLVFGPEFMAWGVFTDVTANMVGKWNDLDVFFGIGTVLSLITLELITLGKLFKILAYAALAVSLFFLAVVNFAPVWHVIALFSLIFLVYIISFDKSEAVQFAEESAGSPMRKIPMTSLAVLLISVVFILGGGPIGGAISSKLNITQIEARPSWAATFSIAKNVLAQDPFLGSGPNRFTGEWLKYKPDGINSTVFWNTDFNFGVGLIPTFLVTTGLLGIITWAWFLGLFLLTGFRAILSSMGDKVSRYLVSSSFLVSLFLWIINVFYIPSLAIVGLTFFFTGLFIASLYRSDIVKPKIVSFIEDPKKGFVSVLLLILFLIGAITVGYYFAQMFVGSVYFQRGLVTFNNEGNVDKAEGYLNKAVGLDSSPSYFRSLAQIDMLRMSNLLQQNAKNVSADAIRAQFRTLLSTALNHAQQAATLDSTDYQNWISLGQVYEAVVPLKIPNAYESAHNAYMQALGLNPKSPALLLTLARLETAQGDYAKAKDYISQTLQQRNNYTDAIFLLAQIQVQEGNVKDAIDSVQAASYLAPNDSGILFQLGILRYNYKDFQGAAGAFEQAVALNKSYANAKYFLGLSYDRLDRKQDAIAQFAELKKTNPDNQEIDLILKNLTAGLSPFTNAAPPIDNQPEKRAKPPVPEKASKTKKTPAAVPDSPSTIDSESASL